MQTSPTDACAYMRAAILAQVPVDPGAWDEPTLRAVFHVLPPPPVSFAEWRARMLAAQTPSAQEISDANDRFIGFAQELPEILSLH